MDQIVEKPDTLIGAAFPKPDAPDKVVGKTTYINDMVLPRMLVAKIKRTDRVHAKILSVDISEAEKVPGIVAIATAENSPKGLIGVLKDNPPLKGDKVRCIRDEIAGVAGETEEAVNRALELIKVEYEDLPTVFDPEEALKEGAPLIHEDKPGNIGLTFDFEHGDVKKAEAESDVVLEEKYELHYVTHTCMGPGCVIADFDTHGKLTIYTQTQYPYNYKMDLAPALDIPAGDIRVIQPPTGGAFGSKLDVYPFEPIAVYLAKIARRPVKLFFSREEEFIASPTRQPARVYIKQGAKKDGTITFRDVQVYLNNGGYTSWGATIPAVMMRTMTGHFRIPNVEFHSVAPYTNNPFAGSFRGYGNVQATYVTATLMDKMAEELGMDPIEFRLKNAQEPGERTPQNSLLKNAALADCIKISAEKTDFLKKHAEYTEARKTPGRIRQGIGIATSVHNAGGAKIHKSDGCGTILTMDDYGRATVITGASEIGQGIDAVITQLVSEELGIPPSDVLIANDDSAIGPWDVGVHASRTTFIAGNSARNAAVKAKQQILAAAARQSNVSADKLELRGGHVVQKDNGVSVTKLDRLIRAMHFAGEDAELVMVSEYYEPPSELEDKNHVGDISAAYAHGAYITELEVDTLTGGVKLHKITAVQDVGKVINKLGIEGQMEGGIAQGIGYGLSEELIIEEGIVKNPNFRDYKVVTAPEMPEIECHFIEDDEETGPFGAKGISELPCIIPGASIANAVYNAIGVRFDNPPITPEKIVRALHGGKAEAAE
ncbi:MAG: xanthine dehydrogenase family protein molybdopterin-binding subunit [Rhodospirillaceae bacterium]|jgi:xanthine dehydrogenase molybdenum-binding subunit|nr:xanthine dehydrogenase family protein molybdopterin-binding subunit [Rhodospirillaceae bacterium]MBT4588979.1 xanthine dehydrogenase family protein molybdopterin-binding subunit [Rhodospirillaceae bacterium]MBT4940099.1 xanthine dehydrogenase family protein molybdopterin-binding subunit [Rhodospirillaceae bacterium]MBT5941961.1 xanthine dehydrogenase family protein molybdopterin-binding subunit [Rhodospirillaceae bacterium]MBT7268366.1 xanthine dehydrogenase family protein molybdopterin-bind